MFSVGINERGAQFNESVEIDMEENTVTYKVPAHNDIDQSDVLLDYNSVSVKYVLYRYEAIIYTLRLNPCSFQTRFFVISTGTGRQEKTPLRGWESGQDKDTSTSSAQQSCDISCYKHE